MPIMVCYGTMFAIQKIGLLNFVKEILRAILTIDKQFNIIKTTGYKEAT